MRVSDPVAKVIDAKKTRGRRVGYKTSRANGDATTNNIRLRYYNRAWIKLIVRKIRIKIIVQNGCDQGTVLANGEEVIVSDGRDVDRREHSHTDGRLVGNILRQVAN